MRFSLIIKTLGLCSATCLLAACGGGSTSSSSGTTTEPPTPVANFDATLQQTQTTLFQNLGLGAALGPHMDDQNNYNSNTLNALYHSFVGNDITQLSSYGFTMVRLYDDSAYTYISAINSLPAGMKLVYQYSLCQSDPSTGACYNVAGSTISQIETQETAKLNAVVNAVGVAQFESSVALVIVGNEDLVVSKATPGLYNNQAIISAMNSVESQLQTLGVNNMPLSSSSVVFNPAYVSASQMSALMSIWTNPSYTGPLVFDLYPYQFGVGGVNATGAVNESSNVDSLSGMINGISSLANCQGNTNLSAGTCTTYINNLDSKGIVIGETGWANSGTPNASDNYDSTVPGSIAGAAHYMNSAVAYAALNNIPTLLFEAYDQMNKAPTATDPENHYGIMSWNNIPWYSINQATINIPSGDTTYQFIPENVLQISPNFQDPNNQANGGLVNSFSSFSINGGTTQSFNPYNLPSSSSPSAYPALAVVLKSGANTFSFTRNCNPLNSGLVSQCYVTITPSTSPTVWSTYLDLTTAATYPVNAYVKCGYNDPATTPSAPGVQGSGFDDSNGLSYSNAASTQTGIVNNITIGSAAPWAGPGGACVAP